MDLVNLISSDVGQSLGLFYLLHLYYLGCSFARILLLGLCVEVVGKFALCDRFIPSVFCKAALSFGALGFLWALSTYVLSCLYTLVYLLIQIMIVGVVISVISFTYVNPEETRRLLSLSFSRLVQRLEGFVAQHGLQSAAHFGSQLIQHLVRIIHGQWRHIVDSVPTLSTATATTQQPQWRSDSGSSPSAGASSSEQVERCVICQDQPKSVLLLPCRHLCTCRDCTDLILEQHANHRSCPLCRRGVHDTIDVYI